MKAKKNTTFSRKLWTSAFLWLTLDTSEFFLILEEKKGLRFHIFGPLWTISTGNKWEISEVGHLSGFIESFVLLGLRQPTVPKTLAGSSGDDQSAIMDR